MTATCPFNLCPMPKQREHAFCPAHWNALPVPLREEIQRRWRTYKQALAAAKAWRESMAKATAVLEQSEQAKGTAA